jgi:hypothetical protein
VRLTPEIARAVLALRDALEVERLADATPRTRTERRCWACGQVKPLSAFHKDASRPDGRAGRCKVCDALRKVDG